MNASIKKITIIYKKKTQIFLFLVERRNNKARLYHEEKNSVWKGARVILQ